MLLSTLLSLFVLTAPAPAADGWSSYANERYGYSIAIPPGLEGQGESDKGDGQVFQDASGKVSLRVWASEVVELGDGPEEKTDLAWNRRATLERWRKDGVRITYQPKGKGWWVLSGVDKQKRVLYTKMLEKDGTVYGFTWSHPEGAKVWQGYTGRIARDFKLP
jgi:hypothetical protein